MIRYQCDRCGKKMGSDDPQRYIVRMEVFAAAGPVDLDAYAGKDHRKELGEVLEDLATADPNEMEDQTYRLLRFDLCDPCRRVVLENPLGGSIQT